MTSHVVKPIHYVELSYVFLALGRHTWVATNVRVLSIIHSLLLVTITTVSTVILGECDINLK